MVKEKISEPDLAYIDDLNAAILQKAPYKSRRTIYAICSFVLIALIWASLAEVDEVTVGTGKIIPSQQIQIVQNLEGGILKSIYVQEGDQVTVGQELLTIDETQFLSDFREQDSQNSNLKARALRLRTELESVQLSDLNGEYKVNVIQKTINFEGFDLAVQKETIDRQNALYKERIRNLESQLSILDQQVNQKRTSLEELKSEVTHLEQSYLLVSKELNLTRPLARRGVVSEVELIKLERTANEAKGQLASAKISLPKLESEIDEVIGKRKEVALKFRSEAQERLQEVEAKLGALDETLVSLQDRLQRTLVKSPVNGTIKTIQINTVGGVIKPGMDLIEIVPREENVLVEARILPKDIAFLRPGLDAVIKLTAYDFTIYGGLKGKVEHISADTITDENGDSFYHIKVRTDDIYYDKNNKALPIIAGMTASVDVLTGKKTITDYLLKPIIRAKQHAFREK